MPTELKHALPQRYTEPAFRIYEPIIAQAVRNWPEVTLVDPVQMRRSFETVTCRLRDAIVSFAANHWHTEQINVSRFDRFNSDYRVAQRPPYVIVGSRAAISRYDEAGVNPIVGASSPANALASAEEPFDLTLIPIEIDSLAFRLLCVLQHQRLLTRPLRLRIGALSYKDIVNLYDVDLENLGDGIVILR